MTYTLHLGEPTPYILLRYKTADGRVPYSAWLRCLDKPVGARVQAYVDRMKTGNFGRSRGVGEGVSELKVDFGPGYRVYYLRDHHSIIVLLCAGDKASQQVDIRQAHDYAADYWRRKR